MNLHASFQKWRVKHDFLCVYFIFLLLSPHFLSHKASVLSSALSSSLPKLNSYKYLYPWWWGNQSCF